MANNTDSYHNKNNLLALQTSAFTIVDMLARSKLISQTICIAAKLKIADYLKDGPKSVDELAEESKTHPDSLYRLLRMLASLGIFAEIKQEEGEGQQQQRQQHTVYDESIPAVGKVLEIESLQKYILKIENDNKDDKLKLMIEDRINRFNFEFVRPSKDVHSDDILYAQGVKGMMAKGPELRMEIVPSWSQEEKEASAIKIRVFRGKKNVFKDDILVSNSDIERLKKFIKENFAR